LASTKAKDLLLVSWTTINVSREISFYGVKTLEGSPSVQKEVRQPAYIDTEPVMFKAGTGSQVENCVSGRWKTIKQLLSS
jgi:hypothetical protein